jgi:nitrogen fixation NifU-like protein
MTEVLKGRSVETAETLFGKFHDLVTGDPCKTPSIEGLGKLAVFFGVREFPVRVKCATLPWHTLRAALKKKDGHATTEESQ